MNESQLCFIGAGNMARSLIGGLLADGYPARQIRASDPDAGQRDAVTRRFGIETFADNAEALAGTHVLILAVKPQGLAALAREIAPQLDATNPLIISVAAGIRTSDLDRWLGGNRALVRCMPNTPALVQSGATALYATAAVNDAQRNLAESILRAVGLTLWVEDEDQMDAVTALSGSGPAYFFLMLEAMQQAGTELGLPEDTARLLALQTAFGAAKMALESEDPPGRLRERVTSPGGTTERALTALEEGGLRELITRAMQAAQARSRELAEELGSGHMNGGNLLGDTLGFVIQVLVGLYVLVLMLRLLLGWLRADFYNPLSQFIVKVTNPPVIPLRRILPPLGRMDTATVVVMLLVQMLGVALVMLVSGRPVQPYPLLVHSLLELISLGFSVFIFAILIQAILSWVNPGGYNPALAILYSLTEPVLRPLRGLIPPISGIDLSPLFAILALEVARRLVLGLLTGLLLA